MKLVIDNLHKKYDKQIAVDDISFEINQAETIGILGPNGAGKTTLFYMIAGLINPDMGNIYLGDSKINNESISTRTSLGLSYLPQESSIFRGLTVEQNILSSLEQRKGLQAKERNELLNSLLVEFNLSEFSETMGIKLSGGERRRTEIARSLASDPKFILLDEPFAGIDPLAVSDLKNTIKKLNKKNIGVLISDHNVRDTMNICSKVIVVNKGRVIANGKPEEIAKNSLVKEVYLGQNFEA
ncbi:MAG: LPS export ABC transporter ATP-binding protein [SAR86 cluster bacterium]|jgi:lipopolysaccharide export system ATP-binding protein|nr:LPS export ABC transporter ATP-binding protein [SAR86 cluster bacterium]